MDLDRYNELSDTQFEALVKEGEREVLRHSRTQFSCALPTDVIGLAEQYGQDALRPAMNELNVWSDLVAADCHDPRTGAAAYALVLKMVADTAARAPTPMRHLAYGLIEHMPALLGVQRGRDDGKEHIGDIVVHDAYETRPPRMLHTDRLPALGQRYGLTMIALRDRCNEIDECCEELRHAKGPCRLAYVGTFVNDGGSLDTYRRFARQAPATGLVDSLDALLDRVPGVTPFEELFAGGDEHTYTLSDSIQRFVARMVLSGADLEEGPLRRCCDTTRDVLMNTDPMKLDASALGTLLCAYWDDLPKSGCMATIMHGASAVDRFPHPALIKCALLDHPIDTDKLTAKEFAYIDVMRALTPGGKDRLFAPLARVLQTHRCDIEAECEVFAHEYVKYVETLGGSVACLDGLEDEGITMKVAFLRALRQNVLARTHDVELYEQSLRKQVLSAGKDARLSLVNAQLRALWRGAPAA